MARFFRRTRLKLIETNRMNKYLLYASGEILLIVVGILIALQINNWNEKNKLTQQGNELISEIKRGIGSDLKELNKFMSNQESIFDSQKILSNWMNSENSYADSLSIHLSRTYIATDFSINYSGYETLKKFGLRRIENDSLRASISNLYEVSYPAFLKFSEIYQDFLDNLLSVNPEHFNEINYMQPVIKPRNPAKLKNDAEYAYLLNSLKNFNQLQIVQAAILKQKMEQTFSAIE